MESFAHGIFGGTAPLVAILRGLETARAAQVVESLVEAGFGLVEVPLNTPSAFRIIEDLVRTFSTHCRIGAGTVLTVADVDRLADIGAQLCISPNVDEAVIRRAKQHQLASIPGAFTPTEVFAALASGADAVKLFPLEVLGAPGVRALRSVVPAGACLVGVGGVRASDLASLQAAGCNAFGLGSWLYRRGDDPADVAARAREAVSAWRASGTTVLHSTR